MLPLLQGMTMFLLMMMGVASAGRPDPVLGRRVPRPTVSLRLPPMEEGIAKVTFCLRGAAGRAQGFPLFTTVMSGLISERLVDLDVWERSA